jgi:hypothetical protein
LLVLLLVFSKYQQTRYQQIPLIDTAVRKTKPETRPIKLSDGGGLHLLLTPSGSRLWRLQYRFGGKQKMLTFAAYPEVSLADARAKREEAKRTLQGNDIRRAYACGEHWDERVRMMTWWAEHLDQLRLAGQILRFPA